MDGLQSSPQLVLSVIVFHLLRGLAPPIRSPVEASGEGRGVSVKNG